MAWHFIETWRPLLGRRRSMFEDLRCVSYSTGSAFAGYVASESPLGPRAPGGIVVVRTPIDRTHNRWELVKVLSGGSRN